MADTKISAMPAASALASTDICPWVQGGTNVKATGAQVAALAGALSDPFEFDTKAAVQAATISGSVNHIRIAGYTSYGDGGGANYVRVASQPGHALKIQSADGAWWEWRDVILTPEMAGAVGDATWTEGSAGTWTGTDNSTALQNAIDAVTYFKLADRLSFRRAVQGSSLSAPVASLAYRITKTLHLGYGDQFITTRIEGPGRAIGAGYSPVILCDFSNGPALAVNGQRDCVIQGITLWGRNWDWINQNTMGSVSGAVNDDTVAANWVGSATGGPTISPVADNQYTQYCGVCVDGYAGAAPGTNPYPNITRPSYAGGGTIYNNGTPSSNTLLRNVGIHGFVVGFGVQTGNFDSNGDFSRTDNCVFENNKIPIAVGNTQSREVSSQGCSFANAFCVWDTITYGHQNGKLGTCMLGCDMSQCISIFNLCSTSVSGPLVFDACYAEAGYRIGDIAASAESETSVTFNNCQFDFSGQNPTYTRGVPAQMFGGANQHINIQFFGGVLTNYWSVCSISFYGMDIRFNGTLFQPQNYPTVRAVAYQCLAHNATAGGLVLGGFGRNDVKPSNVMKFAQMNADTIADNGAALIGPRQITSNRPFCACIYSEYLTESSQNDGVGVWFPKPSGNSFFDKTTITSASLVNSSGKMVLTFTTPSTTLFNLKYNGGHNGDVLWDDQTGSVFFIRSVTGAGPTFVITAVLQNNYKTVAGVASTRTAVSLNSGNFYICNSRYYTPTNFTQGDFSTSSANITNVGNAAGSNFWVTTDIVAGDILYNDDTRSGLFASTNGTIATVAAATITIGGNPALALTKQRLGIFIKNPPSNSSTN